ncbi:MAG: GNAT family N-acetyltransferase, partial [Acidobacteria bacterium]|nr:GNAT family N-acetyltransferase [Acidobacteriota bacterium]
ARTAIVRLLDEPDRGRIWAATGAQGLVGYVVLTLGYSLEYHGIDSFVDELYVVPKERGHGLGKRGLALVETECR